MLSERQQDNVNTISNESCCLSDNTFTSTRYPGRCPGLLQFGAFRAQKIIIAIYAYTIYATTSRYFLSSKGSSLQQCHFLSLKGSKLPQPRAPPWVYYGRYLCCL